MESPRFLSWEVSSSSKLLPFLRRSLSSSFSARLIKRAVDRGLCRVNGKIERFSTILLQKGDRVELERGWREILEENSSQPKASILYEDGFIAAIDKPSFVVCEPRSIKNVCSLSGSLVHRLDKEASGVLLLAKTQEAKQKLEALFAARKIQKTYLAVVEGCVTKRQGTIESFLVRKCFFQGQTLWKSAPRGAYSSTFWQCLDASESHSVVLCSPRTGRTHQLRVHLSEMGHPILGDVLYGREESYPHHVKRLLLHGGRISFLHPLTGQLLSIQDPLPTDFFPYLSKSFQRDFPWNAFL